jgi:hypothetical protein
VATKAEAEALGIPSKTYVISMPPKRMPKPPTAPPKPATEQPDPAEPLPEAPAP